MNKLSGKDIIARKILGHIRMNIVADSSARIGLTTPLVSSGFVNSFDLVELLSLLEKVTGLRIPTGRVGPMDLDTVAKMIETAERLGEPR